MNSNGKCVPGVKESPVAADLVGELFAKIDKGKWVPGVNESPAAGHHLGEILAKIEKAAPASSKQDIEIFRQELLFQLSELVNYDKWYRKLSKDNKKLTRALNASLRYEASTRNFVKACLLVEEHKKEKPNSKAARDRVLDLFMEQDQYLEEMLSQFKLIRKLKRKGKRPAAKKHQEMTISI